VLSLEWTEHEYRMPVIAAPAPTLADTSPLPPELYQDLSQLARLGNASGVRQLIEAAMLTQPQLQTTLKALARHAERYDFNAFLEALRTVGAAEEPASDEP